MISFKGYFLGKLFQIERVFKLRNYISKELTLQYDSRGWGSIGISSVAWKFEILMNN
jgi:hypothetical protein